MRFWGNVVGIVLLIVGAIWTLQGANVIGGSFMSGQPQWLYIGTALVLVALGILLWLNLHRRHN
jgi:hypothetical protein